MAKKNKFERKQVWFNAEHQQLHAGLKVSQNFTDFVKTAFTEKVDRLKNKG